jgi:hypothetical protein
MVVELALFWCAGTWKLSADHCKKLRGVQRRMVRKMMGFKMRRTEDLEAFLGRSEALLSKSLDNNGILTWDLRARQFYFRWAGSIARMGVKEPLRITPKVLHFLNVADIKKYADSHGGAQGHGRRLHVWRWEAEVYEFAYDWEDLALNTIEWNDLHLDNFVYTKGVFNNLRKRGVKRRNDSS